MCHSSLVRQTLSATLLDALDDQHFESALERLEDYEHDFPKEAVPIAVPVLLNRMGRLSAQVVGMFGIRPRFKVTRVVLRLLTRIEDPEELMASISAMIGKIDTLSGWFELIEMVGHRHSVGHGLVQEYQARKLEDQFVDQLISVTAQQLRVEWNLYVLLIRTVNLSGDEDKSQLTARLREHLADDGFVVTLLCTAVNYAYSNGHTEKRLSWDGLVEVFGEELAETVDALALSPLYQRLPEDVQDTIALAQSYASGLRPEEWPER